MFWVLKAYPNIEHAVINDINRELIITYQVIKRDVDRLIACLSAIQDEYLPLSPEGRKEFFLSKRLLFNTRKTSDMETAALFIFLNRTCFNGLYHVNSKDEFNVPHGKYANPCICDATNLKACSSVLQKVEIMCGDFAQTGRYAGADSIYYLDPPYRPITKTQSFTSYTSDGFEYSDQIRLRNFCEKISANGAMFIASNSDPKNTNPEENFLDEIYNQFSIRRVYATRMVNSDPSKRGNISEIMISNITNT